MAHDTLDILLVEDNDADVLLADLAFAELGVPYRLRVASDGVEALEVLRSQEAAGGPPPPDLILLDLNMPRMNGLEVLREVKTHPVWRNIPIIVLTTSRTDADVWEAYHRHANAFVQKPTTLDEFVASLRQVHLFWRTVATLSPHTRPS